MSEAEPQPTTAPPPEIVAALARMGLVAAGAPARFAALAGGVSSDIWLVETPGGAFCVKRALAKLKVKDDWRAPVSRNAAEAAWLRMAAERVPGAAPRLLAEDAEAALFAMEWLPPERYRLWKAELLAGRADPGEAAAVGARLARLHAATAGDPAMRDGFANDHIFLPIRIEPYLLATARRHPDRAPALEALAETTAKTKLAVVHGDVSPKNILLGPDGPVFLDAECAWYGDPAFDLAFCLNHLLLKCVARPQAAPRFLACFDALAAAYLAGVAWEPAAAVEARAARLLPGLFLARVDGKSPVEYVTRDDEKDRIRATARALLAAPVAQLSAVRAAWAERLGG